MNKKILTYISPSIIPSTQANANHVINISYSLKKMFKRLDLFFYDGKNSINIEKFYGLRLNNINFYRSKNFLNKFIEISICINFFKYFLFNRKDNYFISRNLYASFILSFFKKTFFLYEAHSIEIGLRGFLQKTIVLHNKRKTVVISLGLKNDFEKKYNCQLNNIYVLHDAAQSNRNGINSKLRKFINQKYFNGIKGYKIGYFGSLYRGRGIRLIERMAEQNKDIHFLVFGKSDQIIKKKNLHFYGFINPKYIYPLMCSVDILIMPYEKKVGIGVKKIDTSKWMSPLKMFEYMSSKKPIISSNHKVLREVLKNQINSILVKSYKYKDWSNAIRYLKKNKKLQKKLSYNAFEDYKNKYNWDKRALEMIKIIENKMI